MNRQESTLALDQPATDSAAAVLAAPARRTGLLTSDQIAHLARFGAVAAQVGLLVLVIRSFRLVNPVFYEQIAPLVFGGFLVHAMLPLARRLTLFVLLSLTGIVMVFGARDAAVLFGIGLGLIAICHMRLPYGVRVGLLLAAGTLLAALRGQFFASPVPPAIWPILGSMFMFRLITYMYDLRHTRERPDWRRTLAYFFLLPNVAFPLFPVVDYTTFRRTYYDQEAIRIYQRGARWMLRGVVHLLLYRMVYGYLMLWPEDVTNVATLGRHLVANFLLYLRVSGQFHLIVGMLHLFGFRLPETHRFFYLASSFTDLWRRINIYWKDFMMKVVYYPAFFRLRRFGTTAGMVMAVLIVFLGTWLLHAYQWFWLLGTFELSAPDALFWAILAVLLVANTLYEARRGRVRSDSVPRTPLASVTHGLKIAGTFTVMCVLWSLWSSATVGDWLAMWRTAFAGSFQLTWQPSAWLIPAMAAVGMVAGTRSAGAGTGGRGGPPRFRREAATTLAVIGLIYIIGQPSFAALLSERTATVLRELRAPSLTHHDAQQMQRGYYENLTSANKLNSELWEVYTRRQSTDWPSVHKAGIARLTGGMDYWELVPLVGTVFHGAPFRTNRWGMRDRDYDKTPPTGTYRVALLGASYVTGEGVADNETFEWLLEERLEAERSHDAPRIEILNFAVPNFFPPRQLYILHRKVFDFQPDAVFLVSNAADPMDYPQLLVSAVNNGFDLTFDFLKRPIEIEGITPEMRRDEAIRRLNPYSDELLAETYRRIVEDCRARGILPVWMFIPTPYLERTEDKAAPLRRAAEQAGFTILDMSDVYAGEDLRSLWVAEWDYHPNARGHQLIADRLYRALHEHSGIVPLSSGGMSDNDRSRSH